MFHLLIYFQYGLTVSVIGQFLRALAVLTIDSKFFKLADVTSGLRGHSLKLFKPRCRTTVRQNFFSLRIVSEWNKLPQDVVEAPSINTFKNRLDRHWHDMGIQS